MALSDQERIRQLERQLEALTKKVQDLAGRLARTGHLRNPRMVQTVADPDTGEYPEAGDSAVYWVKFMDCTYGDFIGASLSCTERQEEAQFKARTTVCAYLPEGTILPAFFDNVRWWLIPPPMQLELGQMEDPVSGTVRLWPGGEESEQVIPASANWASNQGVIVALIGCQWHIIAAPCGTDVGLEEDEGEVSL